MNNFVKTAQELSHTPSEEVVKVANLIRKLKNIWKTWNNPEYRDAIKNLNEDTVGILDKASVLEKKLMELSSAIKDGDLYAYQAYLEQTKKDIDNFLKEIEELELKTNTVFNYTIKQLPEEYDVEPEKSYQEKALRDFKWYQDRKQDLYFGSTPAESKATQILISKTLRAVSGFYEDKETFRQNFTGDSLKKFLENLTQAVFNGNLLKAENHGNYRIINVETVPFEIPETGISIKANLLLIDSYSGAKTGGRMSLRGTKSISVISGPDTEIDPKSSELPPEPVLASFGATQEVPLQYNNVSELEFAEILREGYKLKFGQDPTAEVLGFGWAQAILESGRPVKLPNNNIGNIKATQGWVNSGKPFFVKSTQEFTKSGKPFTHNQAKWRSYASPEEGAAGYWGLISNSFSPAMKWIQGGDPTSAAAALGLSGYYTANIKKYAGAVGSLYEHFMKNIAPKLSGLESNPIKIEEKIELKDWADQYSLEEKKAILSKSVQEENEVDKLIKRLTAKPITKLVKNSLKKDLQKSYVTVCVKSGNSILNKEFGFALGSLVKRLLDIDYHVKSDGNNVEIVCESYYSPNNLKNGIEELSDLLSIKMKEKIGKKVESIVVSGNNSDFPSINNERINIKRAFILNGVNNG